MRLCLAVIAALAVCAPARAATPACQVLAGKMDAPQNTKTTPLFLASYPTEKSGALGATAFLYDNAVATIALIGCGQTAKARRIGDAMLWAQDHDRFWHDGRLRNAYAAGVATAAPLKLSGWWDTKQNKWIEDQYQLGSDNGNQAWALLALLALGRATADPRYAAGAARIGAHVAQAFDAHAPAGFTGGTFGGEPAPITYKWKSTEHNTDLAAAFAQLAAATRDDPHWRALSAKAAAFVTGMWRDDCACFDAGSGEDGNGRNPQRALDAQLWPLLAIPGAATRYAGALASARRDLGVRGGFAYSMAKDAVWTEGTAQAALLLELTGQDASAPLAAIAHNRSADGYFAIDTAQSQTGFLLDTDRSKPRAYFHLPHLAALAWAAIAQTRQNPFTGSGALP